MEGLIKVKVTRKGTDFKAKTWREFMKSGWALAGRYWHQRVLKKHFERGAMQEYGYQKRKLSYMKNKQRKFGHTLPLVKTGELREQVQRIRDVRETSKGARIMLHGPTYFFQYRKDLNQADKAAEAAKISDRDAETMARILDKGLQKEIDAAENKGVRDLTAGHRGL